jgi:hypothetical protein
MSIVVRFLPTALTAQQYDEAVRRLEESGDFPPDGLDYHVCFESGRHSPRQRDLGLAGAA